MQNFSEEYDVAIVGSGVTGTALLYMLAAYTSLKRVVLIEQYSDVAQVSSHHTQNSQTLHFGDIETNYSLEKARSVKSAAEMVVRYIEGLPDGRGIFVRQQKMVLAVGAEEVATLRQRFAEISQLFPKLRCIERDELAEREPAVMDGRKSEIPMIALVSDDGYSINFGALAQSFVEQALVRSSTITIKNNVRVDRILRDREGFVLHGSGQMLYAKTVVVAAGAHSLSLAHSMGEGKDLSIIPVAGLFYTTKNRLRGKVYTVQHPKLPFAAIHGDPDVVDGAIMRFGPIAKALPMLEIRAWRTIKNFLHVFPLSMDTLKSIIAINTDSVVRNFIARNFWYDLPVIGPWLFAKEAQKIIPSIQPRDLQLGRTLGGIRPQVVNLRTHSMQLGEAKIVADGIIFNITPSPGASVCLANALTDVRQITKWLKIELDEEAIARDLLSDS